MYIKNFKSNVIYLTFFVFFFITLSLSTIEGDTTPAIEDSILTTKTNDSFTVAVDTFTAVSDTLLSGTDNSDFIQRMDTIPAPEQKQQTDSILASDSFASPDSVAAVDTTVFLDTIAPVDSFTSSDTDASIDSFALADNIDLVDSTGSSETITIEGMILSKRSGLYPPDDSVIVFLDSISIIPDSAGNFSITVKPLPFYNLWVRSKSHIPFSKVVATKPDKNNYFVTCVLEESKKPSEPVSQPARDSVPGPPWTISGHIVDSRFETAIKSDSITLTFDNEPLFVTKKGKFKVTTHYRGTHNFHLSIPGYHEVFEQVELTDERKQIYYVLSTTLLKYKNKRREIIVSGKRQPLHTTSAVSKETINRKELKRTAATMNDPIRVLHTLPGVSSESDASARPIVRGGDPLEARVFLDGIPLYQPYHFGGARSSFNQAAMKNIYLYKSGFPSQYHNAQSAIIAAESRVPTDDSVSIDFDLNLLQYDAYLGIPLFNNRVGINGSAQGSYFDFMVKRVMDIVISSTGEDYKRELEIMKDMMNMPDYQDYSGGIAFRPNNKIKFFVNELFNTDRFTFAQADSLTPVTYYYHKYYRKETDPQGEEFKYLYNSLTGDPAIDAQLRDTTFAIIKNFSYDFWWSDYPDTNYTHYRPYLPDYGFKGEDYAALTSYDRYIPGVPFWEIDTFIDYRSNFNVLYSTAQYTPTDNHIITVNGAWQKRWWDLAFPDQFSVFLDNSKYDVIINQFNGSCQWMYTGRKKHCFHSGIQLDYTRAKYDVYAARPIHEVITKGSTNFGDYWGPVTGDSGMSVTDPDTSNDPWELGIFNNASNIIKRIFVKYKGYNYFVNGNLFFEDEWDVTPDLRLNLGARLEVSEADTSVMFSPRVSGHYRINDRHELTGSCGLYTQNNHDISVLALSDNLKPEKAWHAGIGFQSRFLSWLNQKIDIYGKYYYDLVSERIESTFDYTPENFAEVNDFLKEHYGDAYIDSLSSLSPDEYMKLVNAYLMDHSFYASTYSNKGRGYAFGLEYILRYDPTDFWNGWFSITLNHSRRRRHPGWRWHTFPLDRPLLISLVNYYRLPRNYEISVKYRYMSGLPYTDVDFDDGVYIGAYNKKRYSPYQRFDFKIAKGFAVRNAKCHFYLETWNAFNDPNMFLTDSETKKMKMYGINLPFTALFVGFDLSY